MIEILNSVLGINYLISNQLLITYKLQSEVSFIYDGLFLIVTLCNLIFFYVLLSDKSIQNLLFKRCFLAMEFFTNFSITLGVIGTLYSISNEVSSDPTTSLSNVISNNFDAAVITTIIGGLCYGYCSILQAFLGWKIRPHEKK